MTMHSYLEQPRAFQRAVLSWYDVFGRKQLPWQENPTVYRVWVSEIMLQQTQVATVIPYFERWMQAFPDVQALSQASEDQVMAHWQGLGYYSRARNLLKGARYVVERHGGVFPQEAEALQTIPGIGPYTAGAIVSFAHDQPAAIVDGNIKRLFSRLFGIEGQLGHTAVSRQLWSCAEALLPTSTGRHYAQALLDIGATVCKAKNPNCDACPLQTGCFAHQAQRIAEFPTPKIKTKKPTRQGHFLWIESNGKLLLEKRARHVWTGLWCLPEVEPQDTPNNIVGSFTHEFSHYQLEATVRFGIDHTSTEQTKWFDRQALDDIGLPTPIRRFISQQMRRHAA